jgi:hypothetical protein
MSNKVLIILGMHRSGTSLITRWLYKCGLNIGFSLHGPDIGNKDGHFEDLDFLQLHEQILVSNNFSPVGLIDQPINNISIHHREKMKSTIELKNKLYKQWGWKDPRTCLFLPYYRKFIPEAKYLIILRDVDSVVNSLIKRDFKTFENLKLFEAIYLARLYWSRIERKKKLFFFYKRYTEEFFKVWIRYNEAILEHIKLINKEDFILVDYKMLINNSQNVFSHLKDHWLFDLKYYDYSHIYRGNLISNNIDLSPFITDRTLIQRSNELENSLREYIFHEKDSQLKNVVY